MLNVSLLWHMHQPYYVNPLTKTALMPWVRLHAVKGYLDMAEMARRHPNVKMVFNITPVLAKQIIELANEEVTDLWEEWTRVPAAELSNEQKRQLLEHFFKANWDNLIRPNPRYHELLTRRGYDLHRLPLDSIVSSFSKQDYLDLQVWFNLAWCGYIAQEEFPQLRELRTKGRHFTETDKLEVLSVHRKILSSILPRYRSLAETGRVELSTTPFFHPISPLIIDTEIARRAMPQATLPPRFRWPEDLRSHLKLAIEQHEQLFGFRPTGLWPSEGAVCPELISIWKELGFQWFATDEDNLFRSLTFESGGTHDRVELYTPFEAEWGGASLCSIFRDRSLSDFIGFSASRNPPREAANFIMHHIRGIVTATRSKPNPIVSIVLDGENAWEYFPDGGQSFLNAWYNELAQNDEWQTVTMTDYATRPIERRCLRQLHSGSWIQGNYDVWIGDPEENLAWQLLGETRQWWENWKTNVSPEIAQRVWMEIYAAEGSDWFWWYGPDFATDNDLLFDELFRIHLQNVYKLCGVRPPDSLFFPICRPTDKNLLTHAPIGLIEPKLDGIQTTFFEWHEAGRYDVSQFHGTMFLGERILRTMYYGFDLAHLYLRLDAFPEAVKHDNLRLTIDLKGHHPLCFLWAPSHGRLEADGDFTIRHARTAFRKIIEIAIPFAAWDLKEGDEILLKISVFKGQDSRASAELEHHPSNTWFEFKVPGPAFAAHNWSV